MRHSARSLSILGILGLLAVSVYSYPVDAAPGASVDFKQCANDTGSCIWINSILQQNNSVYAEGMSVPQRVLLRNIPSTNTDVHTLEFSHQFTKGGVHAYDFLVGYNQGNVPGMTIDPCADLMGPEQTACTSVRTGANSVQFFLPNDGFVSKDGAVATKQSAYGSRYIMLYGDAPISNVSMSIAHDVADGGDTGDSDVEYILTWTSTSSIVLIEMAGHIAEGGDGTGASWGANLGFASVSGAPSHFKLGLLDGASLGAQDNQLALSAVTGGGSSSSSSSSVSSESSASSESSSEASSSSETSSESSSASSESSVSSESSSEQSSSESSMSSSEESSSSSSSEESSSSSEESSSSSVESSSSSDSGGGGGGGNSSSESSSSSSSTENEEESSSSSASSQEVVPPPDGGGGGGGGGGRRPRPPVTNDDSDDVAVVEEEESPPPSFGGTPDPEEQIPPPSFGGAPEVPGVPNTGYGVAQTVWGYVWTLLQSLFQW